VLPPLCENSKGVGLGLFFCCWGVGNFQCVQYNIVRSLQTNLFSFFPPGGGGIQAVLATYFPAAPAAPKGEMREHVSSSWGWKAVCL